MNKRNIGITILMMTMAFGTGAEILSLNGNWRIQSSVKAGQDAATIASPGLDVGNWYPANVPTTVLAALVADGVYPDPYYGLNLKSIPGYQEGRWLRMPDDSPFRPHWWYRTEFDVPEAEASRHYTLHFDGINYQANVWLNGTQIAGQDAVKGMFRRFEFNVDGVIKRGGVNCLAVEIIPPGLLPDQQYRTKQVQATTGWDDHNPQPPDLNMGIWEDVYLTVSGPARIKHPYVDTDLDVPALDRARLSVSAQVVNTCGAPVSATIRGAIESRTFSRTIRLEKEETADVLFSPVEFQELVVENPRVWWPNPLGPQEMYQLTLTLEVDGQISDETIVPFGIREATTYIDEEGWRGYMINGRRVLIRGGAWMTCDMLLRFDNRRYEALVRYAKEANLNMLRSEGFSIRETDEFYTMCDRYGVMVTQQLFGRSIPDEQLAVDCVRDTILRIRNHPSLVHFLGHDETFPTRNLDEAYRGIIDRYTPGRTYQPHSGAFDIEDRFQTGGTRTGTRELWTYAGPEHYYRGKEDGAWGFAQSGGIGGVIAPYESVNRMIPADQQWPLWTEALSFHTVIQSGEYFDAAVTAMEKRYGRPGGIQEFCRIGQVMNYESARGMYEAYARNKYSAKGITTWKYDAAWPAVMTWQYVDWYLIPSGAYYGAKKACEELHVQYSYDDDSVCVVNSLYKDFRGLKVTARVLNLDMTVKLEREAVVDVITDGKTEAFTIAWPEGLSKTHFVYLELRDDSGRMVTDNLYWLSTVPETPSKLSHGEHERFSMSRDSWADMTGLRKLPRVALEAKASSSTKDGERVIDVTLRNPSEALAFAIRLSVRKGPGGEEAAPCYWDENLVSMLPGTERTVKAVLNESELGGSAPIVRLEGWNVPVQELDAG
ncbi:MAG TPA: hypothetical protein PLM14_05785 [Candidatus Hydrogenedentes bacterium]|nr:hypothetical protein [Candidatus Hydrogenedentota bacterium]